MPQLKPAPTFVADEEDAAIAAVVLAALENPPWSDENFARMRPVRGWQTRGDAVLRNAVAAGRV